MKSIRAMKRKKLLISALCLIITVVFCVSMFGKNVQNTMIRGKKQTSLNYSTINEAKELVADMKIGWNLGNTLDSPDGQNQDKSPSYYETLWEQPITTKAMITEVKKAGFNAVRVPVTWNDHIYMLDAQGNKIKDIDIQNMTVSEISKIKIEEDWMARVKEVIDYVIQNDMYCVLNTHHDVGTGSWPWIFASADSTKQAKYEATLQMLWSQIATQFKDYENNLVFEGFNEIMIDGAKQWVAANSSSVTASHFAGVNKLNQKFVDTVRSSGGNNAKRFLILNTYGAEAISAALDNFEIPTDTVANHLIISAHVYDWAGDCKTGTNNTVYNSLSRLKNKSDSVGAGAIIGEFATLINSGGESNAALADNYYVKTAKSMGITCFYWDDGMGKNSKMNILNRNTLSWTSPKIVEGLIKGSNGETLSTSTVDTNVEPTAIKLNKTKVTLDYDSTLREVLEPTLTPSNAGKSTKIKWKSSNTNVVTVSPTGILAPKGIPELINIQGPFAGGDEGTSTITATITKTDGTTLEASCEVTVTNKVKGNLSTVNLSDFSNWRKGFYDWQKGYYFANGQDRICVDGYLEAKPNTKYTAQISKSDFTFIVRELDANHKFLVSNPKLWNGDSFTTNANTKYLAVSMHKPDSSNEAVPMRIEEFKQEFENNNLKLALVEGNGSTPTEPTNVAVTGVTVTPTTGTIKVGQTLSLTPTVSPSTATNKNVTWSSSDGTVATVNNGVVKGIKAGTATITVTTVDGSKTASCKVTVKSNSTTPTEPTNVAVTGVTVAPTTGTIKVGQTLSLTPTVSPSTATNKNVTWSSSDETVATVNNGVVKGIKAGTATITVTTADGNKTAKATITVSKEVVPIVATIKYDKTEQTKENVTATVTFNKENVTITNNDGKNTYTFEKNGEFTFEYKDNDGNTGKIVATVTWILDKTEFNLEVGYSTLEETDGNVIVTITSETELKEIEGWKLSEDKLKLTKVYEKNTEEEVTIEDINGNKKIINIKIANIKENEISNEDNSNNSNKNEVTNNKNTINGNNAKDSSISDKILPFAGKTDIISIAIITMSIVGIFSYCKLRKNRDIK